MNFIMNFLADELEDFELEFIMTDFKSFPKQI